MRGAVLSIFSGSGVGSGCGGPGVGPMLFY